MGVFYPDSVSSLVLSWMQRDSGKDPEALGDGRASRWEWLGSPGWQAAGDRRRTGHQSAPCCTNMPLLVKAIKVVAVCYKNKANLTHAGTSGWRWGAVREIVSKHRNHFLLELGDTLGPSDSAVDPFTEI